MVTYDNILTTIGRTPLIRLNRIASHLAATVYAKAEFLNPGGSVKDRIALNMIEAAEKEGKLQPGGTIVEATAGNTGVGLALVAAVKGYRCLFVLPDKMSQEKIDLLKAYGAEVVITPTAVAPDSPESYNGVATRLAREIPGAYRPDQFANPENPLTHYHSTGIEIWEDTGGKIDVFVAGMGTGGTISGVARYLKQKNPDITIVGADPVGSILSGDNPKSYKVEGIGEDFIPKTFDRQLVDEMIRVSDQESFNMVRRLAREEGLLVGGSSGTAMVAALQYANRLSEPQSIVVLLPDTGRNYLNKIFSDIWMQENGFWSGNIPKNTNLGDILASRTDALPLVFVSPNDTLIQATHLLQVFQISQLPVIDDHRQVVGSLTESSLMKFLHEGVNFRNQTVGAIMGKPLPIVDENVNVSEAYRLLLAETTGIIVKRQGIPISIISRSDLIQYWIGQKEA
jgi:cystathionine beta-synthase